MFNIACRWAIIDMSNASAQPVPPPSEDVRVINELSSEPRIINATTQEERVT